ncbi:MAG: aminotransferase class IV [Thermodesulfobacteriota bacterium]|nr:aminotransferase class IV [Thermodesulfobacteriota bacterium]
MNFRAQNRPWQEDYLAMYSSQWPGVTTDPDLMMIPIDDHVVHRGDGAFDVMRCVHGKVYQMEEHLRRLEHSARAISLDFPPVYDSIREVITSLTIMGGEKNCLIRIILSRGPGSFSTNPFDCPSSQVYVNVIRFKGLPGKYYRGGIQLVTSRIPVKKSFFANIKSCNYLPNVLMKMEAIEAGCQYSVSLDEHGFLAEGPTENIGVLSAEGVLKFPEFERTLSGITAKRVFHLAEGLVNENLIKDVRFAEITPDEAYHSEEIFLTGTSLNILPVVSYDGRLIGNGSPGPLYARLSSLLWEDMTQNEELLTQIDWESENV